jgi:uncharacterized caspase-like protein
MPRIRTMIGALFALIPLVLVFVPNAARAEKRIALVIGNAGYQAGALNTPANDAGLIAQTLQAAGFDAVGARDLDQDSLRRAFRDFLEKATSSGPDTVAFIYVSGYGVQLEGENYFVPIDARIARDSDLAAEALRMSDYIRPLAALKLKASIVVLDAARANPFAKSGPPLAGGLALVEPEPGVLIAFNAAPGTVAPEGQGPYGPYAQALAEMTREGGLPLAGVFDRTRLRVNDVTKGAEVPWHASKVETSLVFFERASDAPPPVVSPDQTAAIRSRPIRDLAAQEAYFAALERDTLQDYSDFLAAYPDDPMAKRVRAIVAARREALTWRRTRVVDTPPAYWSYLRRYPQGPHAPDAHRRLAFLAAALEPPPSFTVMAYDLPPPPPEEIVYIRRPVLVFDDPIFAFAPPPPPLVIFLAPPPPDFVLLPPPAPPVGIFLLPVPVYRPVPVWVRPPVYVAPPPPNNVIYRNVHNTVVINNVTNTVTITNPSGQTRTLAPPSAQAAAQPQGAPGSRPAAPAALGPALPPSVAQKAAILQSQSPQGPGAPAATAPASTTPSATVVPGTPTSTSTLGGAKPGTAAPRAPAATAPASTTPSAAVTPATPTPIPGAKPGTAPARAPAATAPTSTTPSAAVTPGTPTPTPTPGGSTKLGTRPSQTPPATVPAPTAPSAAVTPRAPTPAPGGPSKRGTPPSQVPPAAKQVPSSSPSSATTPGMPSTPSAATTPVTPRGNANLPSPPHVPAARQATPQRPAAAIKPVAPSPPAGGATPVAPQPPPPAAKLVTPPLSSPPSAKPITPAPAPAAAAARPAPSPSAPTPKVVQPQAKGCPPGRTMVVVNGQQVCK